jgi:hypothetical protein
MPTTADGHIIKVTTYYSSWDKAEIDMLQEDLCKTIGAGVVTEVQLNSSLFAPDNMNVISQERQAVIDASDMPVTDIIKAIKANEVKENE